MKQIFRGLYVFLIALLCLAFSYTLWSAEVDTVWTSDYGNTIQFQHPVTKDLIFVELSFDIGKLITMDSKNGKVIKEVPFKNDWDNKSYISPDGTFLLHTVLNDTYIYEYPVLKLKMKLDSCIYSRIINNDEVVGRNFFNSNLIKYNIKTKEKFVFEPEGSVKDIATSPDGRFIAISTFYKDAFNDEWSKLYLLDAKAMTQIALLEEVKNTGHNYKRMSFSDDGRYLATNSTVYYDDFQRNIYSTETLKAVKNYNPTNLKTEYLETKFLNENLYCLKLIDNYQQKDIYTTQVVDIKTDKTIISIDNAFGAIYNSELNHLYYKDPKSKKIICLNITNLITGVSQSQANIVKYQNKELIINKANVRKVEISDISGKIILSKVLENPFSNSTILPVNLANGSYLINITTDKENFTHKLMILE